MAATKSPPPGTWVVFLVLMGLFSIPVFAVVKCTTATKTPEEKYQTQCEDWKRAGESKALFESSRQFNEQSKYKYLRFCVNPSPQDYRRLMNEIRNPQKPRQTLPQPFYAKP